MTEETIKQILKFRDDRDWKQFHNPKDLAISISLEAAELPKYSSGAVQMFPMRANRKKSKKNSQMC